MVQTMLSMYLSFNFILKLLSWCTAFSLTSSLSTPLALSTKQVELVKKKRQPILPWVTCVTAIELQRAIQNFVREDDNVLELGSLLADATDTLCSQIGPNGKATLVDIQRKEPSSGRSKGRDPSKFHNGGVYTDRVIFEEISQFEEWRRVLYKNDNSRFDVVVIDMGAIIGNDLTLTAISVIQEIIAHQKIISQITASSSSTSSSGHESGLRAIIIKSTSLSSLARRLIHGERLLTGQVTMNYDTNIEEQRHSRYEEPYIIATVGVEQYRRTIPYVVRKKDGVLEVGCHFGTSTVKLHNAAAQSENQTSINSQNSSMIHDDSTNAFSHLDGYCIGVDIGSKCIDIARQNYPHVPFCVSDAWRTAELARLPYKLGIEHKMFSNYDVIYADIGGLSGPDGLLESLSLIDSLSMTLEPRCIVIKSLCMRRLSSSLRPFSEIWLKANRKGK